MGTIRPRRCARNRRRVGWKGRPRGSAARITHASHLYAPAPLDLSRRLPDQVGTRGGAVTQWDRAWAHTHPPGVEGGKGGRAGT